MGFVGVPGGLSTKQMDLAFKLYAETYCPARPPRQAAVNIPAPEGRLVVRGTVISLKEYSSDFGDTWKMTVKVTTDAGTWLCWGTAPASLFEDVQASGQPVKGLEVEFTATLKRGREAHFALFKRPTGCKIVGGLKELEPELPPTTPNMRRFKLWWASRDTRWDVYPQQEPKQIVGFDGDYFWCPRPGGGWYRSPTSFCLVREACAIEGGEWTPVPGAPGGLQQYTEAHV